MEKYKRCKYCKKPGKLDPLTGKVLCPEHRDIQMNLKSIWQAIAIIQSEMPRNR
ncbi:MAG: hypothetical protein PHE43_01485 [Candidatus Nanoarchaeia archaeon]|nr:hypothetical protein [Candidatus Nanoarchaeia archaeon]